MKKILSVIIAALMIFTALPFAAAADGTNERVPESISAFAQKTLIENLDGDLINEGKEDEYFQYSLYDAKPIVTVNFSDGTCQSYNYGESNGDGFRFSYYSVYETDSRQWTLGTHKFVLTLENYYNNGEEISCEVEVEVVENPVESISVSKTERKTVYENMNGDYVQSDSGKWYCYNIPQIISTLETTLTVYYKDGTSQDVKYYDWYNFGMNTGHMITETEKLKQTSQSPWTQGNNYSVKLNYMGAECELGFSIIEFPIESLDVKATQKVIEGDMHDFWSGSDDIYKIYEISDFAPEITLNLKNGTVEKYEYWDMYEVAQKYGVNYSFETDQDADYSWEPGIHTVTFNFGSLKKKFSVEITENPVESISVRATRKLIKDVDNTDQIWEDDRQYNRYRLYMTEPVITVKLKSEDKPRVYTYDEVYKLKREFDSDFYMTDDQSYSNQWGLGKHTAKGKFMYRECEFEVEVVQSPVKSVTVVPNGELYLGNAVDGVYYLDFLDYTITVNYNDGSAEEYNSYDVYEKTGYWLELDTEDQKKSPWTEPGTYTVKAKFMGVDTSFKVELVENPYSEIKLSGDEELVISLVRKDKKETENYTVLGIDGYYGGYNKFFGFNVATDNKLLKGLIFSWKAASENGSIVNDLGKELYVEYLGLESNKIDSKWFETYFKLSYFADKYAALSAGNTAFRGNVTVDRIDAMLSALMEMEIDYRFDQEFNDKIKEDDKGYYYVATAAEAKELLQKYFGETDIDITYSKNYNYTDDTVIIRDTDIDIEYSDGFETCGYNPDNKEWVFRSASGLIVTKSSEIANIKAGFTGDAELNSSIDIIDLVKVKKAAANAGGAYDPFCDLDGDGNIGASDVAMLRKILFDTDPRTAGDINGDGTVDMTDYAVLADLIAENTDVYDAPYADINRDGKIDKADSKELRKLMSRL